MAAVYENILTETKGRVGIIRLNRPKALNALCADLVRELGLALDAFEADTGIGCMVLTGSDKAFAAGADIKEMKDKSYQDVFLQDFITVGWEKVSQVRKPIVAAVAGCFPDAALPPAALTAHEPSRDAVEHELDLPVPPPVANV